MYQRNNLDAGAGHCRVMSNAIFLRPLENVVAAVTHTNELMFLLRSRQSQSGGLYLRGNLITVK